MNVFKEYIVESILYIIKLLNTIVFTSFGTYQITYCYYIKCNEKSL